jgi:hypothetical protein
VTEAAGLIQVVERSAVSGAAGVWLGAVARGVSEGAPTRVGAQGQVGPGGLSLSLDAPTRGSLMMMRP